MGRGIKANTEKSQYEVDLTDYVDGNSVTYTGGKLGVNAPASITSVNTEGAIEGDGSDANPVKLDFNDSIVKGTDGKYGVAVTGLTCASIDDLPEKPWKKGTTILAKQDGACVRLSALDSIFQEIGVGITADKTNSFTDEEYNVVVTVFNTGEGKNELTNLNIVGPANTEDYEIKEVSFTNSEADEVEQVDNLTYNIRGLKKGDSVKVKYTVVPKVLGNYQFTAAVNPNSPLDKDLGNNTATLILNAQTKVDPNYVASEECPLITITDVETGEVLQQAVTSITNGKRHIMHMWEGYQPKKSVIYGTRGSAGLQLRVSEPSTLLVYGRTLNETVNRERIFTHSGRQVFSVPNAVSSGFSIEDTYLEPNTVFINDQYLKPLNVTYTDDVLTINDNAGYAIILAKPRGKNCAMQGWVVLFSETTKTASISVTDPVNGTVNTTSTVIEKVTSYTRLLRDIRDTFQVIPAIPNKDLIISNPVESIVSTLTVKKGKSASATVAWNGIQPLKTNGLVTITDTSITVSKDATPADSVRSQYLNVIIEE